jgi:3-hydroxyisobutyrate dehydrogenase-like beta-hydroxyacid dehydrogenase
MTEAARTGVIGLGAMGLQMARHMVAKGFEVCGTDIDRRFDRPEQSSSRSTRNRRPSVPGSSRET